MNTFERTAALAAAYGPAGCEGEAAQAIAALARPYADEVFTDGMGNLIVHKKGTGPRLLLMAHMDTSGLIVTYIEENGALRVGRLGGGGPRALCNAAVRFKNGVCGAVKLCGGADKDKPKADDLYIDIGAGSREEARAMVAVGDAAVYAAQSFLAKGRIISPHLDGRAACGALLSALERFDAHRCDLYLAFTAQESLGLRGAKTAAYGIDPEYAVIVDAADAWDWPGAPKNGSAVLGGGGAIKVMDSAVICHPEMVERLERLARERGIKTQRDVQTTNRAGTGAIHQSRVGVITGALSIPCRYLHTPTEMAELSDIDACAELLATLVESI